MCQEAGGFWGRKTENNSKAVMKLAMLYQLGTIATTKKQETELEVAELRILCWPFKVTKMDNVPNSSLEGTTCVAELVVKTQMS